MDNATDALYMAFAMLAFVLAITISIAAFTQITTISSFIVDSKDRGTNYSYLEYGEGKDRTDRIVSAETIVPALYRMYEENFIIRFYDESEKPWNLFESLDTQRNKMVKTNQLDLRKLQLATQQGAREFVEALLSNPTSNKYVDNNTMFNKRFLLQKKNFYDIISKNKFKETVGIYYEDDLYENDTEDINKTEVRLITYTKQ